MGSVQPRRRPNLQEEVAAVIRDRILTGELHPGDRINQERIAEELGVSKLPVREALISLERDGLVENVARRGSFVAQLTPEDVRDHYAIYGLLSGMAAERAADVLHEAQLDHLERLIEQLNQTDDSDAQTALNDEFHGIINRAGASRRLRSILWQLAQNIPRRFYEQTLDWEAQAHVDHVAILQALRARNGAKAARLVADHLRASGEHAVDMLIAAGFWREDQR